MARTTATSQAAASATEFQNGLEAVAAAQKADKDAKLSNKKLQELLELVKEGRECKKDLAYAEKKMTEYEKLVKKLQDQHAQDKSAILGLTHSLNQRDASIKEYKLTITNLQGALNKNGTVHDSQLNRDLKDQTRYASKVFLFRNVKFFEDDEDAIEKTKMVVPYLPKGMASLGDLSIDDYAKMYKQISNEGIQAAKQSVQAEGKKAAKGTFIFMFCLTCFG